jgi:hypothetical protein
MYHLSSSSLKNLFTTGDPISLPSHEFEGPKSNTNPLDNDCDGKELEGSESFEEMVVDGYWGSGFELDSGVEVWSVSLFVLVSGFVEQRVRERRVLVLWTVFLGK